MDKNLYPKGNKNLSWRQSEEASGSSYVSNFNTQPQYQAFKEQDDLYG